MYTSVVVILIVGYAGGLISQLLRMPRIICMILFGIALLPVLHVAVIDTPTTFANPANASAPIKAPDAQNPASAIRAMALLIALARGGLSMKLSYFKVLGWSMVCLATIPYTFELILEGLVAPVILPASAGFSSGNTLLSFAAATTLAPLSPSIVIPNMLAFVEQGLTAAGRLVLVGAPLEVSTALLTEGIFDNYINANTKGADPNLVLYFIPVYIFGSAAYGFAYSFVYYEYTKIRQSTKLTSFVGKMDPVEPLLVFVFMFILCYTTSIDDVNIPRLVGFFSALAMAVGVQFFVPDVADALALKLKPVWTFAEAYLFVLTGCVVRSGINAGQTFALFGPLFAVLLIGQIGRMVGDIIAGFLWQITLLRTAPWKWNSGEWSDVAKRIVFVWFATVPKATLQASLGPKMGKTLTLAGWKAAGSFVGPASAIAILYMATIGSFLTFSVGTIVAKYFQDKEPTEEVTTQELVPPTPKKDASTGPAGVDRVGPVINILSGVPAPLDPVISPKEVTIDTEHRTPSSWATGAQYGVPAALDQRRLMFEE